MTARVGEIPLNGVDASPRDWLQRVSPTAASRLSDATRLDLAIATLAFMFVVFVSPLGPGLWASRTALLLVVMPFGLAVHVLRAIELDGLSLALSAFLLSALLSTVLSGTPWLSLVGGAYRHSSFLVLLGAVALFQLARMAGAKAERLVGTAVVAGVFLSGFAAVVQLRVGSVDPLGRPAGLAVSPVYLGAFASAAVGWFSFRLATEWAWRSLVGLLLMAYVVGLSGSRIAQAAAVLVACGAAIRSRRRVSLLLPLTAAIGVALGVLTIGTASGSDVTVLDRTVDSGIDDRLQVWSYAFRGWLDRPVFGHGPGRFQAASQPYFSDEWAVRFGTRWGDAHNLPLEWLVALGFVGVAAALVAAVRIGLSIRGPMVWMAVPPMIGWALEPAAIQVFALVMLLLGVGVRTEPVGADIPRCLARNLGIVGVVLGSWFFVSDAIYDPIDEGLAGPDTPLTWWYSFDPSLSDQAAARAARLLGDDGRAVALALAENAVRQEPDIARWHGWLALRYLQEDRFSDAQESAMTALELQPNLVLGWRVWGILGDRLGDQSMVDEASERLCAIGLCERFSEVDIDEAPETHRK